MAAAVKKPHRGISNLLLNENFPFISSVKDLVSLCFELFWFPEFYGLLCVVCIVYGSTHPAPPPVECEQRIILFSALSLYHTLTLMVIGIIMVPTYYVPQSTKSFSLTRTEGPKPLETLRAPANSTIFDYN